jgi:ubiquitin-protein ligase
VHYDDANVRTLNALLIGPEDTPYEYGMFEFQLVFPNGLCMLTMFDLDYPSKAPQ